MAAAPPGDNSGKGTILDGWDTSKRALKLTDERAGGGRSKGRKDCGLGNRGGGGGGGGGGLTSR